MSEHPTLRVHPPHGEVRALALVLHGGRTDSSMPVHPWQAAVLRMVPFATTLSRDGARRGLAVGRLEFRVRGWNGRLESPVHDAHWALDHLAARFPGVPIGLVGHSMGGRTVLRVADHPGVRAVAAVAPWLPPGEPVVDLTGTRILVVHGTEDRMTDPRASATWAIRARASGGLVSYVSVIGDRHAMLRRARIWHELVSGFLLGSLYGGAREPAGTARDRTDPRSVTSAVRRALAGEPSVVV